MDATHAQLNTTLTGAGAPVAGWYYCPHHPEGKVPEWTRVCGCRKPAAGMLEQATKDLDLDLAGSWVVGDQWRDIEAAHRAGARSILVRTGYGRGLEAEWPSEIVAPTLICDDLLIAAEQIAADAARARRP